MSRFRKPPVCGQCKEPIEPGEERAEVERGEDVEPWHKACADDEAERLHALAAERELGVHGEDGPQGPHYEVEGAGTEWRWHLVDDQDETIESCAEPYSSQEAAQAGADEAAERAREE